MRTLRGHIRRTPKPPAEQGKPRMAIAGIAKTGPTAITKGPPCSVCDALATLPPKEADALRGLLADPAWRYSELSDALAADPDTPLIISGNTLSRHARGRCSAREKLR